MPAVRKAFKMGRVRGYLRGRVWCLCYHENGRLCWHNRSRRAGCVPPASGAHPVRRCAALHMERGSVAAHESSHDVSDAKLYIQSATLNGKPLNVPKFHHSDIIPGGSLVFEMGPTPNMNWGTGKPAEQ